MRRSQQNGQVFRQRARVHREGKPDFAKPDLQRGNAWVFLVLIYQDDAFDADVRAREFDASSIVGEGRLRVVEVRPLLTAAAGASMRGIARSEG
jgi:hypothetical protein